MSPQDPRSPAGGAARAGHAPAGDAARPVAPDVRIWHVPPDDAGRRLDQWLAAQMPACSRARIQAWIADGAVTRAGAPGKAGTRVRAGDEVCVTVPPTVPATPQAEELQLDIVFEDADVLVLNKPPGLVVHPAPGHAGGTLVNGLLFHCADLGGIGGVERPGIVHRLDKDTSGLMVVAKHDAAMADLVRQFQAGRVEKEYLALAHGRPPPAGTIDAAIGRHPRDRKRMAVVPRGGKAARSHYRVRAALGPVALVAVTLVTGRTHQIRVHLAHLGFPVVGDPTYGDRRRDQALPGCPARQMLHAARLAFDHPRDGRRLVFERPPPADMQALIGRLQAGG